MLKKTPLYYNHLESKAKIIDFHGWQLPVEYVGALKEYEFVRNQSGLFDTSHMGRIFISGENAGKFLQCICTNNLDRLKIGEMLYTTACNEKGKMLDDFMVYRLSDKYICVVNSANRGKIYNWLCQYNAKKKFSVSIEDKSDSLGMIALQGPLSFKVLSAELDLTDLYYLEVKDVNIGTTNFIVSRSGYTGEDGFEIIADNKSIIELWKKLLKDNKREVFPCGLAVRDMLRLEMGYSLYGNDIDESKSPIEANLDWIVDFKDGEFVGKNILIEEKNNGVDRKLKGFRMIDKAMPRTGYKIFKNNVEIGRITSGGFSPMLNGFIGMAYINTDFANDKEIINIEVRDKLYKAEVMSVPFINSNVIRRKSVLS